MQPKMHHGTGSRLARGLRTSAFVLFLVVTPTSYAAVYKCAAKDGSTAYSDQPCDNKPEVVQVTPDPLHTKPALATPPLTPAATKPTQQQSTSTPSSPAMIAPAQDKSARETSASSCSMKAFNEWIKAQGHPLPDPNVRIAKMIEISNQCRRPLGLSDMNPPAAIPTPKPILQGTAGATAATNLKELVKSGSIERLQKYLSSPGVDINDRPGTDEALLDYAAEQNQVPVARFLLDHGARVDAVQNQGLDAGYTALHRAAITDAADVAQLLLAHGAEVNFHGPLGITPLILAASNGSRRTAEVLLNHGADVSTPDGHSQTALSEATAHNHGDIVKLLLIHLPAPTSTSMNAAAMRGDLEALRLMVRHDELAHDVGASLKDQALRFTILGGPNQLEERQQMIELLLADGADIDNQQPGLDVIPVMLAPTPDMVEFLFAHGANKKAKLSGAQLTQWFVCNNPGKDPVGTLQVVIRHGIDIGGTTRGTNPLSCAAPTKNPALLSFLTAHQVGVSRPGDPIPQTPPTPQRPPISYAMTGHVAGTPNVTRPPVPAAKNGTPLFPKRPCTRLDSIDNSRTPIELYSSLNDCMQSNRDVDAINLFVLAGMDSAFDSQRVADKTAGQARQILIMALRGEMPADAQARFDAALKDVTDHPPRHAALCEQVKKVGPPTYFPAYMVNHGLGVMQSALSNQPPPGPLVPNFDPATTWMELQTKYLNCTAETVPKN
jgi:ankyrin repeat protein